MFDARFRLRTGGLVLASLLGCLLPLPTGARAGPDLYLDGEALANVLTCWVLENTSPEIRLAHRPRLLALRLKNADAFHDENDPRVRKLFLWLGRQEKRSVRPAELFQKAFETAEGNLEEGFLYAWDVLREGSWNAETRNNWPWTLKLFDITGEADAFRGQWPPGTTFGGKIEGTTANGLGIPTKYLGASRGDTFSAWYHFAGTALNSFLSANSIVSGKRPEVADFYTRLALLSQHWDDAREFGDYRKRHEIDFAGSKFGAKLYGNLKTYATCEAFQASEDAERTEYLYDNPEVYGPTYHLKPDQTPWEYREPRTP